MRSYLYHSASPSKRISTIHTRRAHRNSGCTDIQSWRISVPRAPTSASSRRYMSLQTRVMASGSQFQPSTALTTINTASNVNSVVLDNHLVLISMKRPFYAWLQILRTIQQTSRKRRCRSQLPWTVLILTTTTLRLATPSQEPVGLSALGSSSWDASFSVCLLSRFWSSWAVFKSTWEPSRRWWDPDNLHTLRLIKSDDWVPTFNRDPEVEAERATKSAEGQISLRVSKGDQTSRTIASIKIQIDTDERPAIKHK